ncbi:MAG: 50S ribosomal protein L22 [Planctomycetes bacterium]|nr:50S ribosomal protein L22 [Planctomycetota bacterium]
MFHAIHRHCRMSPRKVRLVVDQIRGKNVNRALEILGSSPKRGAFYVRRVVRSALANAERQIVDRDLDLHLGDLEVRDARVDSGTMLKRWRPRSRGMATRIHKQTCHITIGLDGPPISSSGGGGRGPGRRRGGRRGRPPVEQSATGTEG